MLGLTSCSTQPAQLSGGQRQQCRDGPRDRSRAAHVPDRRAPVEPRREAPRPDARLARRAPRALSVTTIYVTHDQTEAMTLGQRVAVMRDGQIVQVDEPAGAVAHPARRVRRGVHRLAVHGPRRGDRRRRRGARRSHVIPLDPIRRRGGGRVVLGVRPGRSRTGPSPTSASRGSTSTSMCSSGSVPTLARASASRHAARGRSRQRRGQRIAAPRRRRSHGAGRPPLHRPAGRRGAIAVTHAASTSSTSTPAPLSPPSPRRRSTPSRCRRDRGRNWS